MKKIDKSTHIEDNFNFKVKTNPEKKNKISTLILIVNIMITLISLTVIGIYAYRSFGENSNKGDVEYIDGKGDDDNDNVEKNSKKDVSIIIDESKRREEILDTQKLYNNDDIVGFIQVGKSMESLFYTQTSNNYFYLDHGLDKSSNENGTLILDTRNDITKDNYNTIIYGKGKGSSSLKDIEKYADEDIFNSNRTIYTKDLYNDYEWEVFSFYETSEDFGYIQVEFKTEEDFYITLQSFKNKSRHITERELKEGDRILTITAPSNESETVYVLHSVLIKKNTLD